MSALSFLTEPEPPRGRALDVAPGIRRLVAANGGPLTYHGTNTYLVEGPDGLIVIDPGPDDARHRGDIVKAAREPVALIVLTHHHPDHCRNAPALRAETGAPIAAFALFGDAAITPDITLADGQTVAGLTALHTPGHAGDHLCLSRPDGVLFSGDHVMGWSTSIVSPPDGDMSAYLASLVRLLERPDRLYLPGHGPAIADPHPHVAALLGHRRAREAAVLDRLAVGPATLGALARHIYPGWNFMLRKAGSRSILAHLLALEAAGQVTRRGRAWYRRATG